MIIRGKMGRGSIFLGLNIVMFTAVHLKYGTLKWRRGEREVYRNDTSVMEIYWDESAPTWTIWKNKNESSQCKQYKTRFAMFLPRTYLISYPGSGNTWVRYLLEAASGIFSGSVYNDQEILSQGYLGELDDPTNGRTLVQKAHGAAYLEAPSDFNFRYEILEPSVPAVLIVRDPQRAILSYWKFINGKKGDKHTNQIPETRFHTTEFRKFVRQATDKWENIISDRLLWHEAPIYVLYYELLIQDPIYYIREMLEFLRIPADEGRLSCVKSHLQGPFKRPDTEALQPFTAPEVKRLHLAVKRVSRLLRLSGFSELSPYPWVSSSLNYTTQ